MKPRILHIAPMNTSGVPGQFVLAERKLGFESRLVTLFKDERDYFEDICLNLPFINFPGTRWIKKHVSAPDKTRVDNILRIPDHIPKIWQPHSLAEKMLIGGRDLFWKTWILPAIKKHRLGSFDVYQLDGGLDLYRNSRFMCRMKRMGKKIICCYTGSDLRTRGVISPIDKISDLNVTVEFDHLYLHPKIRHIFFPFDHNAFKPRPVFKKEFLRIGHAPTSWQAKGSDIIVPILLKLEKEFPIKVVLIQGLSYKDAIALKATCDIFIDQIGDLGYGINSLESLAMEIATCSSLAPGFGDAYPDHPFIEICEQNLEQELIKLIRNPRLRQRKGIEGRQWVIENHDAIKSAQTIHQLASITPDS